VWLPSPASGALERVEVAVFDGSLLLPGMRLAGPALIEHADTTILVPPSTCAVIDELESCVIAAVA
jgi:N-methylhydantoinase A/oxoprolinase/acetone carboxylase beta subunit